VNGAFDLNAAGLSAIKRGINTACMSPEHFLKGYVAIRLLAESALKGTKLAEGWWNPGHLLVTPANINKVIARQASVRTRRAYFAPIVKKQFANPKQYLKPLSQVK
jgi:ribose transport system substrate-binding protein